MGTEEFGITTNNENVGDLTSNKRGSGARFNGDKPDYSLFDFRHFRYFCSEGSVISYNELLEGLDLLGEYQFSGDVELLKSAHRYFSDYLTLELVVPGENSSSVAMDEVCKVWEYGKKKYAQWNWAKGMAWSVPMGCIGRHARKILFYDEQIDVESKVHHTAHIICNLEMLLLFVNIYPEGNDLPFNLIEGLDVNKSTS